MSIMTKVCAVTYEWGPPSPEQVQEATTKLVSFSDENGPKTDMSWFTNADNTYSERLFRDQAAADEWVAFQQTLATKYNRPIVKVEITDV
jgi:hypothetical protein